MHHPKLHKPADDLRVQEYSRSSTAGLAVATGLSLLAIIATVVMIAI